MPRLGLLGRILLALLGVGLLPLGVASVRLVDLNREAMFEQVLRTHAVAAGTTATRIEAFLAARQFVAGAAAENEALLSDPRSPAASRILGSILTFLPGVAAVSLRDERGAEVVRAQRRGLPAEVETLAEGTGDEPLEVVRSADESFLRLQAPLPDGRGHLVLLSDLGALADDLRPVELGRHAELVLADLDGRPLVGPLAALDAFPPAQLAEALTGRLAGSGRYEDPRAGTVLGAFAPVPGTRWVVISRQPGEVAEATARAARRRAGLAVVLAVVLTLALALGAHRTIVRPIRDLVEAQRRLAGPSAGRPTTGTEIHQLEAAFRLLEQRLREREELTEVFVGRYRVEKVAGEGAMGTVFQAWDPALERPVALKTVRFEGVADEERAAQASRLLEEAVAVARFNHPHVVGIYDLQTTPEVAFLALEYVDGTSLEQYLQGRGRLDPDEVVSVALGVVRGLKAAHERSVVHRDVKPANVLLGRDGAIKIADFGISELMTNLSADPHTVFGTPGYLAPETIVGDGYGPEGDVYALGVTMYRLLTGRLPYSGRSMTEMLVQTMHGELVPPRQIVGTIPEALEALVVGCLRRTPAERCSAEEVERRLEALEVELGCHWELRLGLLDPEHLSGMTQPLSRTQLVTLDDRSWS